MGRIPHRGDTYASVSPGGFNVNVVAVDKYVVGFRKDEPSRTEVMPQGEFCMTFRYVPPSQWERLKHDILEEV